MTNGPRYDIQLTHFFDAAPERVYVAFTDPDEFAGWYGPAGFPAPRDTVRIEPHTGGVHSFAMVGEADPAMRTSFDGRFTEVVSNQLLASSGSWTGIPGLAGPWPSHLRVEFHAHDGGTRLELWEGPHPPGTTDLGRQAWEMMFTKLDALLTGEPRR